MQHDLISWLYLIAILIFVSGFTGLFFLYRAVKRDIEEALKNADPIEQARIRNQLVKAMFPPRFPRR
jgi:uncharacterized protein YneF (UPF0154 family)